MLTDPKLRSQVDALWETSSRTLLVRRTHKYAGRENAVADGRVHAAEGEVVRESAVGCVRVKNRPRIFHECTNADAQFEYSWLHSWMVICFAGMVARVESLRGRMGESTRQEENLFESLLAESFGV